MFCEGKGIIDQEEILLCHYDEAKKETGKRGGTTRSHFEIRNLSEYEKEMRGYFRLIVAKTFPLYYFEDTDDPKFSPYEVNIGKKNLVVVLLKILELVKNRIASKLQGTKLKVMFDGWT